MNGPADNSLVILAYGPQPISSLAEAGRMCGKDAIMDSDVARKAGAIFAIGSRAAIEALDARLSAVSKHDPMPSAAGFGLSKAALDWLECGERDASSNTMLMHLLNHVTMDREGMSHPSFLGEWRQCQLLIEAVPEVRERLSMMATASNEWRRLVQAWPRILEYADQEAPDWRTQGMRPSLRLRNIIQFCIEP